MERGYKRKLEDLKLVLINETMVDQDLAMSKRRVISESTTRVGGEEHTIVKYNQVLQSFVKPGDSKRNWNGRGYTEKLVVGHLDKNPIIQHEIKNGTWLAEYGHPYEPIKEAALGRQNLIEPKYICNKINKYWVEGDLLMSECETLAESWGKVLTARILTNLPAMASLRSIGRMGANGFVTDAGFWITTFDTVVRPSHKEAMQASKAQIVVPHHSMNESVTVIDVDNDLAKQFILSESARQIEMICAVGNFDANSIKVDREYVTMQRLNETGTQLETVYIPFKVLVGSNYHQLF